MRVLGLSDIHGNVGVVSRLREREKNIYDLIIVAGDIGQTSLTAICDILDSFSCPVAYVFGNHDFSLSYDTYLGKNGHHLHNNPLKIHNLLIVGYSGCPANWGQNPIAERIYIELENILQENYAPVISKIEKIKGMPAWKAENALLKLRGQKNYLAYRSKVLEFNNMIQRENRHTIEKELLREENQKLVKFVVTHDKMTRTKILGSVDCFIHGHHHEASCKFLHGQMHLNVAALDISAFVYSADESGTPPFEGNLELGNYISIEIVENSIESVVLKKFGFNEDNWSRADNLICKGAPVVGVDKIRDSEVIIFKS